MLSRLTSSPLCACHVPLSCLEGPKCSGRAHKGLRNPPSSQVCAGVWVSTVPSPPVMRDEENSQPPDKGHLGPGALGPRRFGGKATVAVIAGVLREGVSLGDGWVQGCSGFVSSLLQLCGDLQGLSTTEAGGGNPHFHTGPSQAPAQASARPCYGPWSPLVLWGD